MENDFPVSPAPAPANDVWSSLIKGAENIFVAREARKASAASTASPSGNPAPSNPNPFAGFFSPYPQNDTKQQYQNQSPLGFSLQGMGGIVGILLLGLLAFFVLSRR